MHRFTPLLFMCVLGGCSFAFISSTPVGANASLDCNESRAAPITDVTLAALGTVGAVALFSAGGHNCDPNDNNCVPFGPTGSDLHAAGGLLLIPTAIYALSALHGFSATRECRARHATPAHAVAVQ